MKKSMSSFMGMLILIILVLSLFVLPACSKASVMPTTSAPPASSAPAAPATSTTSAAPKVSVTTTAPAAPSTTTVASTTATAELKTLKIGYIDNFAFSSGVDVIHIMDIYNEMYKEQGGLDIGGEKYQIQFVSYDNQNSQSVAMAALNKLIFEDKVKYITTGFTPLSDGWLPVTEANKVVFVDGGVTPPIYDPKYNYCFEAGCLPCQATAGPFLFVKMFPDVKDVVMCSPDTQMGHVGSTDASAIQRANGLTVKEIFYPASSSDLSSLGTQVAKLNPPVCCCQGGGPLVDSLAQKAIYAAGWRGVFFTAPPSTALNMQQVTPPEVMEGQIVGAIPCEFDPPLTDAAKDFKARWIAKYDKYEGQTLGNMQWDAIRCAMQATGSTDVDKVAAALHNGLQYSGAGGDCQMVPRMDFGDSRTTGSACKIYLKKIVKGQPTLIGTMSLEDAVAVMNKYYVKK